MYIYPKFISGKQEVTRVYGKTAAMLMNITVYKLLPGEAIELLEPGMETAVLILSGDLDVFYEESQINMKRAGVLNDLPTCLHVPKDIVLSIKANTDSELIVQSTKNDNSFTPRVFTKKDIVKFTSCKDKWEGTATREVVDIINIKNSPYSNMVLGEVYALQGRWWSYIPHHHSQPEVYYYKFDRPEGFGACFIGEKAHTVKDGSAGLFEGGNTHAQVTAPGYPMYCCWMIRHLPGDPWDNTRTDDPRYSWLLEEK